LLAVFLIKYFSNLKGLLHNEQPFCYFSSMIITFMRILASIAFFVLLACAEAETSRDSWVLDNSIVGGFELSAQDDAARYVVMVYDEDSKKICTGTLIEPQLILTAGHCVGRRQDGITLAFGVDPMTGKYVARKSIAFKVHNLYNSPKNQNDLALIYFQGKVPQGYMPALVAPLSFPVKVTYDFTAVGYGRFTGRPPVTEKDAQGSGRLRSTDLKISSISKDEKSFIVAQNSGRGICSGDSGGPALMRLNGRDYIVGVASAVIWSGKDLQNKGDACSDRSMYMNVSRYGTWIKETSQNLLK
jgi:secreted trypsin-like serine protease